MSRSRTATRAIHDEVADDETRQGPRTAAELLAVLSAQIAAIQRDRDMSNVTKTRLLVPLAALTLKTITTKTSDFERGLPALEEMLSRIASEQSNDGSNLSSAPVGETPPRGRTGRRAR
jgi:hypothetical protein